MEFEFLEPIRPGVRVRSRGRVIDKYSAAASLHGHGVLDGGRAGHPCCRGRFNQMLFAD